MVVILHHQIKRRITIMDFRMNGRMALKASVHPGVAQKRG